MSAVTKPIKSVIGGGIGLLGNVLGGGSIPGVFGGKEYSAEYPAPWAYPQAEAYTNQINSLLPNVDALRSYGPELMGYGKRAADTSKEEAYLKQVQDFVNAGSGSNNALWNLTAKRYMDELTPRFSGAGLLTSGPGVSAMSQGMENLATTYADAERKRQLGELGLLGGATSQLKTAEETGQNSYQLALQGLQALESLPIEVRRQIIATLFGQNGQVPGVGQSILGQIGGGTGIGNILAA